jgi:hypothetical protein
MESESSIAALPHNQSHYRLHAGAGWISIHSKTIGTERKRLFTGQIIKQTIFDLLLASYSVESGHGALNI